MKKLLSEKRGFTLTELLIALAISSMLLVSLVMIFSVTAGGINKSKEKADLTALATNLGEIITNEINYIYCENDAPAGYTLSSDSLSFSKTNTATVSITTETHTGERGTVDVLCINGEPVFDPDYYKACSLSLAFSFSSADNVFTVVLGFSGRATHTATITVKPLSLEMK